MSHAPRVLVSDPAGALLGPVVGSYALEVNLLHNQVSTWTLACRSTSDTAGRLWDLFADDAARVRIEDPDYGTLLTGPMTSFVEEWSAAGDEEASGAGLLRVSGQDDMAHLADRLAWPDPANPVTAQTTATWSPTPNPCPGETALRQLVNVNAGPGAQAGRQVAGLTLEPVDGLRGGQVTAAARFAPLLDKARQIATAAGLGFHLVDKQFRVYVPADRTGTARFARPLGNLRALTYERAAPTATHAIVGGSGTAAARTFRLRTTGIGSSWGRRVEAFVDSSGTTVAAELDQAGDDHLAENYPAAAMTITAVDTPRLRYGVDYQLGDKVTVEARPPQNGRPAVTVAEVVRGVAYTWTPADGRNVAAVVGNEPSTPDERLALYKQVSLLSRRILGLEVK